jgi:imidazolonepropionase-like amidohydrolase
MGFFVEAGFRPAEALRVATTGPAEFLGHANTAGINQAGTSADLVLLDADLLQDISNTGGLSW